MRMPLLLPVFQVVLIAATASSQTMSGNGILDRFVLVRSPHICFHSSNSVGLLVFNSATPPKVVGTHYQILTGAGRSVPAAVVQTVTQETCDYGFLSQGDISFGVLASPETLHWSEETPDALVALESASISRSRLGTVSILDDKGLQSKCLSIIQPLMNTGKQMTVKQSLVIEAPRTGSRFLFVSIDTLASYDEEEPTGFLFSLDHGTPRLLLSEHALSNIFTVSDIDEDGVLELLVYCSWISSGSFELRLFDGDRFRQQKMILYEWMD